MLQNEKAHALQWRGCMLRRRPSTAGEPTNHQPKNPPKTLSSELLPILSIWTGFVTLYDQNIVAEVSYMDSKSRPQADLWISILCLTPATAIRKSFGRWETYMEGSLVVLTNVTLEQPVHIVQTSRRARHQQPAVPLLTSEAPVSLTEMIRTTNFNCRLREWQQSIIVLNDEF